MKRFLFGLAVGALGAYAAMKLIDKDTRDEWYDEFERTTDRAKEKLEYGLKTGRGKAMRAGVRVRQEYRDGKKKINETAGDLAGKLAENLTEFEEKAKAKANS
ncbi:MAG: hypothetical protein ACLVKO_01025 [Dysgonomonas sp.]